MNGPLRTEHDVVPNDSSATPMMLQYLKIREAHPGCLLFYRMGDFYEMFFTDAEVAAKALGIALTKRGRYQGNEIPMCGVPVHAVDNYLQKLIKLGHKVAVCEQMEDPAEAKRRGTKSVVRRDVVRLITPGTLTEETLLDGSSVNHLAALAWLRGSDELALSWCDISTGDFATMVTARSRLTSDLARLAPSEILCADAVLEDVEFKRVLGETGAALSPMPSSRFDSAAADNRLRQHFGLASLEAFGILSRAEISAAGALLDYLQLTQKGQLPHLRTLRQERAGGGLLIDAATRTNLELVQRQSGERAGSLLATIDRTVTSAGRRQLAARLSQPLAEVQAINERLDAVDWLVRNSPVCEALRAALKAMPDMERALARLSAGRGGPRDLAMLRDGLQAARSVANLLRDARSAPNEIETQAKKLQEVPHELAEVLTRALAEELHTFARDGNFLAPGFDPALDENRALRDDTRQVVAALQSRYVDITGLRTLRIKHNNILGYFIEVNPKDAGALTDSDLSIRFRHRQTMAGAMRFTSPELEELEQKIAAASERALAIELMHFSVFVGEVVSACAAISAAAAGLAALDCQTGLAVLAIEQNYVRPTIDTSSSFEVREGRHPVVEAALSKSGESQFTPNDCALGGEEGRVWLLTGPNMAGKSTFLRQNALIIILAQMGSFVPAASARIGIVDRLFSRVGAADDLARGRSTFMVEMVETAAILNQATARSFVILDEIGRGTATFDGLSIAWAALEYLHGVNRCRALFATHYHELTALSVSLQGLVTMTMAVKEWRGDIVFLHDVVKGAADRSYGIQAARLAGLPNQVIDRAFEVLRHLESQRDAGKAQDHRFADDLPLFSLTARQQPTAIAKDRLRDRLDALEPDDLSPREALALLYELKSLSCKSDGP
jgi:DNA mismatch repair protein MutS